MSDDWLSHALGAKGFMPEDEGMLLHRRALERLPHGPVLEVGTYCGKSAIWLGGAAREVGGTVFTIDHHRGSGVARIALSLRALDRANELLLDYRLQVRVDTRDQVVARLRWE